MTNWLSLDEIEKKAFRSTFQDGIWDIYLGLLLFFFGFQPILMDLFGFEARESVWWSLIPILIAMAGFFLGKRFITVPRMGRVKFGPERKKKRLKVSIVLSVSVLVGLVLYLLVGPLQRSLGGPMAASVALGVFFVNCVVVFSLGAYYLDYGRAYLYGWFFGLAMPLAGLLRPHTKWAFPLVFGVFCGTMLTIGVVLLVRFIRQEPVGEAATG
jgi:hypothetical protein